MQIAISNYSNRNLSTCTLYVCTTDSYMHIIPSDSFLLSLTTSLAPSVRTCSLASALTAALSASALRLYRKRVGISMHAMLLHSAQNVTTASHSSKGDGVHHCFICIFVALYIHFVFSI